MLSLAIPRVVFDTNIFVDAANGALGSGAPERRIEPAAWRSVVTFVEKNYLYAISPVTTAELLTGVAQGGPKHFHQNKVALRKLKYGFSPHVHLPYAHYFTRREVFGQVAPYHPKLEEDFDTVIEIVLSAPSLEDLRRKRVEFRGRQAGIRLEKLLAERQSQRGECLSLGMQIRAQGDTLSRGSWARAVLRRLSVIETPENLGLVNERLDACFHWEKCCHELSSNRDCKLEKIPAMLFDMNQLQYLAAPDARFVTRDEPLVRAVSASAQRDRIFSWDRFVQIATQN